MFRLIFAVLTLSAIAVILVLTAGPSQTAEARFIRWDCSDWQPYPAVADADNQLASAILETLAANRGKTLYCALDQSDTWTKRQVHDHAHRHNDRDRTQYDGSQGQGRFRGFTAGQEGWLTDGEAGITGVSPERIFEFPQQERRRRRWKTVTERLKLDNERLSHPVWGWSGYQGSAAPAFSNTEYHKADDVDPPLLTPIRNARKSFCRDRTSYGWAGGRCNDPGGIDWAGLVRAECESQGYPRARNIAITDPGAPDGNSDPGIGHWEYRHSGAYQHPADNTVTVHHLNARQFRIYSVTCEKRYRVRR